MRKSELLVALENLPGDPEIRIASAEGVVDMDVVGLIGTSVANRLSPAAKPARKAVALIPYDVMRRNEGSGLFRLFAIFGGSTEWTGMVER